jgi:4-hydroxy-tetrahydrodipicolinate synthase
MLNLQGTITALITPFINNDVDGMGLIENIQFQLENKTDAILVLGTTGEAPTLSPKEQEFVIATAVKAINGSIPLLVGTGSNSTFTTIENTKKAIDLGADGVSIILPYYNKPTQDGILKHFEAIVTKTHCPIVIYNNPTRTGINIETSTLEQLLDFPQIIGIKDCSGNFSQVSDYISLSHKRSHFSVFSGDDMNTVPMMALGAKGVVSIVSNLIPDVTSSMVNASLNSDFQLARSIHFEWLPFFHAVFFETSPAPIKEAMDFCGLPAGSCRLPLAPLRPENRNRLIGVLKMLNLSQNCLRRSKSLSIY